MNWKSFKVKVSDYLDGDNNYTADEYEAMFKAVCVECEKDGNHQIVERDGYFFVEKIPEPTELEKAQTEISELKCKLAATDYVVTKIAEGVATSEEYSTVLSDRQAWRARINVLESRVQQLQAVHLPNIN